MGMYLSKTLKGTGPNVSKAALVLMLGGTLTPITLTLCPYLTSSAVIGSAFSRSTKQIKIWNHS